MSHYNPQFKVAIYDKLNIEIPLTGNFLDRLLTINVSQSNDQYIDKLSMTFDADYDRLGASITLPETFNSVNLSLGYTGHSYNKTLNKVLSLFSSEDLCEIGTFEINQFSMSGGSKGLIATLSATSKSMRKQRTVPWGIKVKTLTEMLEVLAADYNLTAVVDPSIGAASSEGLNQREESDSAFLSKIAKLHNAIFKTTTKHLYIKKRDDHQDIIPVDVNDILSWDLQQDNLKAYSKVTGDWFNPETGETESLQYPSSLISEEKLLAAELEGLAPEPFLMQSTQKNKHTLQSAIEAKYLELNRQVKTIKLQLLGSPHLEPEVIIALNHIHPQVNGEWVIQSLNHVYSTAGFTTDITASQKNS